MVFVGLLVGLSVGLHHLQRHDDLKMIKMRRWKIRVSLVVSFHVDRKKWWLVVDLGV